MSPEVIGAIGVAVTAVAGAVGSKIVDLRKAAADREAALAKADQEAEARKDAYRDAFIVTLQAERAKLVTEADHTREKHGDCLALVGELTGRVESLEVQGNTTEAKLRSCVEAHELSARDARSLRERLAVVEKRSSDPEMRKVAP